MNVRAKFRCQQVNSGESGTEIVAAPVVQGSLENNRFFRLTPSGQLQLHTVSKEAAAFFEPGEEFYLTFSKKVEGEEVENA